MAPRVPGPEPPGDQVPIRTPADSSTHQGTTVWQAWAWACPHFGEQPTDARETVESAGSRWQSSSWHGVRLRCQSLAAARPLPAASRPPGSNSRWLGASLALPAVCRCAHAAAHGSDCTRPSRPWFRPAVSRFGQVGRIASSIDGSRAGRPNECNPTPALQSASSPPPVHAHVGAAAPNRAWCKGSRRARTRESCSPFRNRIDRPMALRGTDSPPL